MSLRVLVADTHESIRDALCDICAKAGHEADSVCSGEEAVERVRKGDYGVVLLEFLMKDGIGGVEAGRRIREFNSDVPIYIVSTLMLKDEMLKRYQLNGYIDKTKADELIPLILAVPDLQKKLEAVSAQYKNVALVSFAGQPMVVACDGNCETAGSIDVSEEGFDTKPENDSDFPNRYCVRACLGRANLDPRHDYSKFIDRLVASKR